MKIRLSGPKDLVVPAKPARAKLARGRTVRRLPGQMNKTEEVYAGHLKVLQLTGEVLEVHFEAVTFRLAKDCRYTPDFMVMLPDGSIEFHEVKGHWEDDARVKIKVAACTFPFRFVAITKVRARDGGGWSREEF